MISIFLILMQSLSILHIEKVGHEPNTGFRKVLIKHFFFLINSIYIFFLISIYLMTRPIATLERGGN